MPLVIHRVPPVIRNLNCEHFAKTTEARRRNRIRQHAIMALPYLSKTGDDNQIPNEILIGIPMVAQQEFGHRISVAFEGLDRWASFSPFSTAE